MGRGLSGVFAPFVKALAVGQVSYCKTTAEGWRTTLYLAAFSNLPKELILTWLKNT